MHAQEWANSLTVVYTNIARNVLASICIIMRYLHLYWSATNILTEVVGMASPLQLYYCFCWVDMHTHS